MAVPVEVPVEVPVDALVDVLDMQASAAVQEFNGALTLFGAPAPPDGRPSTTFRSGAGEPPAVRLRRTDMVTSDDRTVATVLDAMQQRIDDIPPAFAHRRIFAETYLRTTRAVGTAIDDARFADAAWVQRWDVVFAALY